MIKTHNVTGKKYLCKKQSKNDVGAINYKGSGLKWKQHLKEFGKSLSTEILFVCPISDKNVFRKVAIDCSLKFNIVNDPGWMNMIIEEGQGGSTSETNGSKGKKWIFKNDERKTVSIQELNNFLNEGWQLGFPEDFKKTLSEQLKGKPAHNKGKKMKLPNEYTSKISKKKYNLKTSNYTPEMRSLTSKKCLNRPEVLEKFKKPKKPMVTAKNENTGEIKTLGRKEWYDLLGVNYKRLLKNKSSKNWKLFKEDGGPCVT